jgi:Fe-S cluster assembly ATP-binding protein
MLIHRNARGDSPRIMHCMPPALPPLLTVERLAYAANGRTILSGLDLVVREGEIHALLGANGTGKTTLARIVMGCAGYVPAAGTVRFSGRNLAGLPMHERARLGISMAWQEPVRFEGVTVEDYLSLRPSAIPPAACLQQVGFDPALFLPRALDKTLSGGERKRIELASMIALRPRLALLDEPAAGIDMPSLEEIEAVIAGLRDAGGSVLLITHVEPVARIADRASYLCGGRIVYTGDPATAAERYRQRRCNVCDGVTCAS